MPIAEFRAENFRCLENIALTADPKYNVIFGANASGKTSLLEALAYLGRGKSFRGAPVTNLVRHGTQAFVLFGKVSTRDSESAVGVRNSREGLEVRIDGESNGGAAALAEVLPLQVIDPDVHDLVAGGPDGRRRYLDWVAFHVEQGFLPVWRRFRRALKQRNAVLRSGSRGLEAWNAEFIELALAVDAARKAALATCGGALAAHAGVLLDAKIGFEYRSGWKEGETLADALAESVERDVQQGSTQVGPHRGDIRLTFDERQARRLVSRGQQKLLACSMVLAATEVVQGRLARQLLLLLDDPAAELDSGSLRKLMSQVIGLDCQVVATALDPDVLEFPEQPSMFHVEQGVLTRA